MSCNLLCFPGRALGTESWGGEETSDPAAYQSAEDEAGEEKARAREIPKARPGISGSSWLVVGAIGGLQSERLATWKWRKVTLAALGKSAYVRNAESLWLA